MVTKRRPPLESTPDKVTGGAGIAGALLLSYALSYEDIVDSFVSEGELGPIYFGIAGIASLLLLGSTIGLRGRLRPMVGRLGRVGMGILLVAFAVFAIGAFLIALGLIDPVGLGRVFGATGMLGTPIGTLALGIALWHREIGSRIDAALLILAFPGQFLHILTIEGIEALTGRGWGILFFVIPFSLGWLGLCYGLWNGTLSRSAPTRSSTTRSE